MYEGKIETVLGDYVHVKEEDGTVIFDIGWVNAKGLKPNEFHTVFSSEDAKKVAVMILEAYFAIEGNKDGK